MEVITIASTALSAVGAIYSGYQKAADYQAQAQAQERNAAIQRENASIAARQASVEEEAQRRKAQQILGAQRAAIAQSGIGYDGTTSLVMKESAANAELDALNIRYEGELKRRGLLMDAQNMDYEAGMLRSNAKSARTAGFINAGSSLLSGYSDYRKPKAVKSGGES